MIASSRPQDPAWCCIQAGHRELYGVPRALHRTGALGRLITDLWAPPQSLKARILPGRLGRRLGDRYHSDLAGGRVTDFGWRTLGWEAAASLRGWSGRERVLARNDWWGSTAAGALRPQALAGMGAVFSYCYEARRPFAAARELGLSPVLGQIDPGPVEDAKTAEIVRRWPAYRTPFVPGAPGYYESWREECRLARRIVVNSEWSRAALVQAGVDAAKIAVCPLVYTPPAEAAGWRKSYPAAFTPDRPLRVLFLGQCILRKGVAETIEAADRLAGRPVEFQLVGNTDIDRLEGHFGRGRIRHSPRVSRAECHAYYRAADIFLFPTHSDGFGLTQLEAQAWRLPILASSFCAEVAEPGRTGWILPEVTGEAIAAAVGNILAAPAVLGPMSERIGTWRFGLEDLGRRLKSLVEEPAPPA